MITRIYIILGFLFCTFYMSAQDHATDTLLQEKLAALSMLEGHWKGTGWVYGPDGQKHAFEQSEHVAYKLDGTIMTVEGIGRSNGETSHHALALISFDKSTGKYKFSSHMSSGRSGDFEAEMDDGRFVWSLGKNIRYIIAVNDDGHWHEIGEMHRGEQWFQFFEMTLERVKTN